MVDVEVKAMLSWRRCVETAFSLASAVHGRESRAWHGETWDLRLSQTLKESDWSSWSNYLKKIFSWKQAHPLWESVSRHVVYKINYKREPSGKANARSADELTSPITTWSHFLLAISVVWVSNNPLVRSVFIFLGNADANRPWPVSSTIITSSWK